jgi:hypothetical protein
LSIALTGHIFMHFPQFMHLLSSIKAFPFTIYMASTGHFLMHFLHDTHFFLLTHGMKLSPYY